MRVPTGATSFGSPGEPFLHPRATRRLLRVSGPDAREFLHNILTNDVRGLDPGWGNRQLLLTATGKIAADFWCQCVGDAEFHLVAWGWTEDPRELLDRYAIMDEVDVAEVTPAWRVEVVEGRGSAEVLERRLGIAPPRRFGRAVAFERSGCRGWVVSRPELAEEGYLVVATNQGAEEATGDPFERLGLEALARLSTGEELIWRLARGIPRFGVDYSGSNNPVEAGLDDAYSLTKGCFPGQEVVSKATRVGGVRRRLRWLKLEGAAPPSGEKLFVPGGSEIGWVTSAAAAPAGEGAYAFGYVLSKVAIPGTELAVGDSEGPRAEILQRPTGAAGKRGSTVGN